MFSPAVSVFQHAANRQSRAYAVGEVGTRPENFPKKHVVSFSTLSELSEIVIEVRPEHFPASFFYRVPNGQKQHVGVHRSESVVNVWERRQQRQKGGGDKLI